MTFWQKSAKRNSKIIQLLNETLEVEYSIVNHCPRIASVIEDEGIKELTHRLGHDSIVHADVVAGVIYELGGEPKWGVEQCPDLTNIKEIFQQQLKTENRALELHRQIANMVSDDSLKDKHNKLAQDEEEHIRIVEEILSQIDSTASTSDDPELGAD